MKTVSSLSQVAGLEVAFAPSGFSPSVAGKQPAPVGEPERTQAQPSVESVVKGLNDAVKMFNTNISFSIDKDTGKTVIKVIDAGTKEVIRQIPPEDVLRIAAHMKELLGILYDDKR